MTSHPYTEFTSAVSITGILQPLNVSHKQCSRQAER